MKESKITDKQLDEYIDEMRKTFPKENGFSANGIAMSVRALEKAETSEDVKKARKTMLMWYTNELAREGKLKCDHCGNKMEVYYIAKCFHCEEAKPKIKYHELNYFEVVKWVEHNESEFNEDDLWDELLNLECLQGNDTYTTLPDPDKLKEGNLRDLLSLIKKHFPKGFDHVKWFVSW